MTIVNITAMAVRGKCYAGLWCVRNEYNKELIGLTYKKLIDFLSVRHTSRKFIFFIDQTGHGIKILPLLSDGHPNSERSNNYLNKS